MKQSTIVGLLVAASLTVAGAVGATPTTLVWNPSTDVQAPGTLHLGVDNYFSVQRNATTPVASPTYVGLTYGVGYGLEVGVDMAEPLANPFLFNAKWGLPENGAYPAFAVGIQSVGTTASTQSNIAYGLLAKTLGQFGRVTAGYYTGKRSVMATSGAVVGEKDGVILAWDLAFGDKWWASVDWASGRNVYGALAVGASYKLADNVSLLGGYVFYNDERFNPNDTATVQLDIDF